MYMLIKTAKGVSTFLLIVGLCFATAVFTMLFYLNLVGDNKGQVEDTHSVVYAESPDDDLDSEQMLDAMNPSEIEIKRSVLLEAPLVMQYPELPRGCEITSLTMLLQYSGIDVTKMHLADIMPRTNTPIVYNSDGSIEFWGDPNDGFVGDITLNDRGFGIYHEPLFDLLQSYIPESLDLTGESFDRIKQQLSLGIPVVAWTTTIYEAPKQWVEWNSPNGKVKTTFLEHAVLVVGYDKDHVYLNDPLKKHKNVKVKKDQFIESWEAMGSQALSYDNVPKGI